MTKEIRTTFRNNIANITINRRKSKAALKNLHRRNGGWHDHMTLGKESFFVSRWDARHTMLAYGFLKGKSYEDIEQTCREEASASFIASLANTDTASAAAWLRGE